MILNYYGGDAMSGCDRDAGTDYEAPAMCDMMCGRPPVDGGDYCLTCLVATVQQFGCGAWVGTVEGGEVVS